MSQKINIVLLGDSTLATGYLPKKYRVETYLERGLEIAYPMQSVAVNNFAKGGEHVAMLLLSGRYQDLRRMMKQIDIAVIRYGQNDAKLVTPVVFGSHLKVLIDLLMEDYPGVHIVLETGLYFDPAHMARPRNERLDPYWQQTRLLAEQRALPLSDVYAAMARETVRGNWDLRVRRASSGRIVLDDRLDRLHHGDLQWFSDGHPNAAGNRVAASEQLRVLCHTFPGVLPQARTASPAPLRTRSELEALLESG